MLELVSQALETYGTGEQGCQYSATMPPDRRLPHNAPIVAPKNLVGPNDTIVQNYTPMGLRVDAPLGQVATANLFQVPYGLLYVAGVRSFNAPDEVVVERVIVGNGAEVARNASAFDAAAYRTTRCFCPVDWGCADTFTISVRGLVPNARLNWVLFGTWQQSFNSCYPSAGTLEEHAAALWGLANGRDPNDRATLEEWKAVRNKNPAKGASRWLAARLRALPGAR